jgi:hypothetical protein
MLEDKGHFVPGFEARVRTLPRERDENFTESRLVEGLEAQLVRIDRDFGGPVVGGGDQPGVSGRLFEQLLFDGELVFAFGRGDIVDIESGEVLGGRASAGEGRFDRCVGLGNFGGIRHT